MALYAVVVSPLPVWLRERRAASSSEPMFFKIEVSVESPDMALKGLTCSTYGCLQVAEGV